MSNDIIIVTTPATLELVGVKAEIVGMNAINEIIEEKLIVTRMLKALRSRCILWHDAEGKPFASISVVNHLENLSIESKAFKDWVSYVVYHTQSLKINSVSASRMEEVCASLSATAKFDGATYKTAQRVAKVGADYYIDLCNEDWSCIKIDKEGWEIIREAPIKFIRSPNARPLPMPISDGAPLDLFALTNIPDDDQLLVLAWILESYRPDTPYPVLEITGEQGSAKSTTQEVLRLFVDPSKVMLRAAPKSVEDIYIAANNSHLISFENLSKINPEMSDALCVVATGGGYASRTLYTNQDETVLSAHNPVVLNGINKVVTRPDLVDRVVSIDLPVIKRRIDEAEHSKMIESSASLIFGGLLDLFSETLSLINSISIDPEKLPRMADFTVLGEAMSRALGNPPDTFLNLYIERRKESVLNILDASPVAKAIVGYVNLGHSHVGTISDLLVKLNQQEHKEQQDDNAFWPKSARGLASEMRRLAPALRQLGIKCEVLDRKRDGVWCEIKKV